MMDIGQIQKRLEEHDIDGWLLYDYHGSNRFARELLGFSPSLFMTRKFFYWIPVAGEPEKLVHAIEAGCVDFLPGQQHLYLSWADLEEKLGRMISSSKRVAMEYSAKGINPSISVVDGGTIELVRQLGFEVISSDDLLQHFTSVLSDEQIENHKKAAQVVEKTVSHAWELIAERIRAGARITEYDVQKFILSEFTANNCITEDSPICAVGPNSASPHYMPSKLHAAEIHAGDFILIDLWCKLDLAAGVYADITQVAVAASEPTPKQQEIFSVVVGAREKTLEVLKSRLAKREKVRGCDLDDVCRGYIKDRGYEKYFIHRTGHNLDGNVHGAGANLDNFETADRRKILAATCFSIEPGIYLPGEFGVRLECNVLVNKDHSIEVTAGKEDTILCLL